MKIYHFDEKTGERLGQAEAAIDPLETKRAGAPRYLLPASATLAPPPEVGEHEAAVFDPGEESWYIAPDFRGAVHYDPETGQRLVIETLGVLPEVTETPPADLLEPRWTGWTWIEGAGADDIAASFRQSTLAELAATDAGLGRVVEDLIELLTAKGTITQEELPQAARDKIEARKQMRSEM
jgi:hypothetical protein